MAYLQLSLYGIPAVIIHGNTLTDEEWSRWYTPVYMVNGWAMRENTEDLLQSIGKAAENNTGDTVTVADLEEDRETEIQDYEQLTLL